MLTILAADGTTVNLKSGWDSFKAGLTGFGPIWNLLTTIGALFVVFAVAKFVWDKRRGGGGMGGGGGNNMGWVLALGVFLCAPLVVIPSILTIVDLIANAAIRVLPGSS